MVLIKQPQNKPVPFGQEVSTQAAARPGLGAAEIGRAAQSVGKELEQVGIGFMKKANKALSASQYSNAINGFTKEVNEATFNRFQQTVDEEGNPTFATLGSDVNKIVSDAQQRWGAKIANPEIRAQFDSRAADFAGRKGIAALREQRRQFIDMGRASSANSINTLVEQGMKDSMENRKYYQDRITEIVDQSVKSGLYSHQEGARVLNDSLDAMSVHQVKKLIDQDPYKAQELLSSGNLSELGIKESQRLRLKSYSESAVKQAQSEVKSRERDFKTATSSQQKINETAMELLIDQGKAKEQDIVDLAEQFDVVTGPDGKERKVYKVTEMQKLELLKRFTSKHAAEQKKMQRISDVISQVEAGQTLISYSKQDINNAFLHTLSLHKDNQELKTISGRAKVAGQFKGPVTVMSDEIANSIKYGNTGQAVDAANAYDYLSRANPQALENMNNNDRMVAEIANNTMRFSSVSPAEAIRRARKQIYESKDIEVQSRTREFRNKYQGTPDKDKNRRDAIRDMFDPGIFGSDPKLSEGTEDRVYRMFEQNFVAAKGDEDAAKSATIKQVNQQFGTSEVSDGKVMFLPPEKIFPDIPKENLREFILKDIDPADLPEGISKDDLFIKSGSYTASTAGGVVYKVGYEKDGIFYDLQNPNNGDVQFIQINNKEKTEYKEKLFKQQREKANEEQIRPINVTDPKRRFNFSSDKEAINSKSASEAANKLSSMSDKSLDSADTDAQRVVDEKYRTAFVSAVKTLPENFTIGNDKVNVKQGVGKVAAMATHPNASFNEIASMFKGMHEKVNRDTLAAFLNRSAKGKINPATTPWCAAFANAVIRAKGLKGTGSNLAKSFLKWGEKVDTPQKGDVMVFHRTGNPMFGHVGFYAGETSSHYLILGGNQGDKVQISKYPKSRLAGIRRAPSAQEIQDAFQQDM